jgi:hypothetical protein
VFAEKLKSCLQVQVTDYVQIATAMTDGVLDEKKNPGLRERLAPNFPVVPRRPVSQSTGSAYDRSAGLDELVRTNVIEHHMYCIALMDATEDLGSFYRFGMGLPVVLHERFLFEPMKTNGAENTVSVFLPMHTKATKPELLAHAFTVTQKVGGPVTVTFAGNLLGRFLVDLRAAYDADCIDQYSKYTQLYETGKRTGAVVDLDVFCDCY